MILTEEEARTKWCPFYQTMAVSTASDDIIEGTNRAGKFGEQFRPACIASECMAWRWGQDVPRRVKGEDDHDMYRAGYCGLAGKP